MRIPRGARACATGIALAGLALTPLGCRTSTVPPRSASAVVPARAAGAVCHPASLERQAAATLIVGLPGTLAATDPLAVSMPALGVGGILLTSSNVRSAQQVRQLLTAIRHRRGAPLLVAADEEGGRVTSFGSVFGYQPAAREASRIGPAQLQARATTLGRDLRSVGVTVDFAPVLDVTASPDDAPIGDRSFSADPRQASADALAVARGLTHGGITPVLKHFPGLGETGADTHVTGTVVTAAAQSLQTRDLKPFVDAIRAGAPVVMVGHAQYPALGDGDLPASLSPDIYSMLKALNFHGMTLTDSLGMGAVNLRWDFPVAAVKALAAGSDGLLTTDGNQALRMRNAIVAAVRNHQLPAARLADAAAHVTAMAGGDPYRLTCQRVSVPKLG